MEQKEALIWKSESSETPESMVSVSIGRAITTLLSARTRKLNVSISRLSLDSNKRPSVGSLEDSLWFLHKFVKDAVERDQNLDDILIPIIQHSLMSKDLKHVGQGMILLNWLFQDEFLFQTVAKNLGDIIVRKDDRFIALAWCVFIRSLVEYESFMDQCALNGIKDNYSSFLKINCSYIPHLLQIVCKGSTLQDGFELPSRLSVSAADCILAISEALTKKPKALSNKPKALNLCTSDRPISLVPAPMGEKKVKPTCKSSDDSNFAMAFLLWDLIEELITLMQRLLAWSRKNRSLHAKGVELVLKWLQEIKGQDGFIQDEAGANIHKTGALLLTSCWKHYSVLLHLEDNKFSQHCKVVLDQYMSGIQYYTDNHAEGHAEGKDGGVETRKFFLNCLCLLLGRFDSKKFESTMSEYGMQISRILISQLHCTDEDVIAGTVCIFKEAIFKLNNSSGNGDADRRQMDSLLPLLLNLLDERDGIARAVVMLIAEYCFMTMDSNCLKQVLKRLASGNALQRRNAMDVVSQLVCMSSDSGNKLSHLSWQDIANNLLERLSDEEIAICQQASNLLSVIDPLLVMPSLIHLLYSSNEELQSYASTAFIGMLKHHNEQPELICLLLDCLSNLSQGTIDSKTTEDLSEGPKVDIDRLLKLIPEWSKSVQNWSSLIIPLLDKMFAEPANATIVRFLSYISEHLAEAADVVLCYLLSQMKLQKGINKGLLSAWESRSCKNEDLMHMQQTLFERLCPLLIIRLLPLRVFNDLESCIMNGQLSIQAITQECGDVNIVDECIAAFLLQRALNKHEFEDVRKLAAELCGRLHPQVLFPVVSSVLENAASFHNILRIKACLFAICTSLVIRGRDAAYHPVIFQIRKTIEAVLLWPSLNGDEVSKAQHGCIDCLALMICAELQANESFKGSSNKFSIAGKTIDSGNSTLAYVVHQLTNDKDEVSVSSLNIENSEFEETIPRSFRLCMANVLISACQKISDSGKKSFARRTLPNLIHSVEVIIHSEIRAACIQVLFSAVYHLKSAVKPYSADLLKLSLKFLRKGSEKERMAGAKLMASLMASEDDILGSISEGLLEARIVLSMISSSDPSPDLRVVCKKLLACITSP